MDFKSGLDSGNGTLASPYKTVSRALKASRSSPGAKRTILLRAGMHHLSETIALDGRDNGLTIQNYNGEAAWLSGGVPLKTSWTKWKPDVQSASCEAQCQKEGHCCTGTTSSYQHPSCAMGCLISAAGATTLDECVSSCHAADNKCESTFHDLKLNMCGSCPTGCDASDGVGECLEGCRIAFGVGGPNIWVTTVDWEEQGGVDAIEGLFSLAPHARFTRARWSAARQSRSA